MTTSDERKFELAWARYRKDIGAWSHDKFILLPGYGKEDLEQEIAACLFKAVQTYDPAKGIKFESWWRVIRDRRFLDLLKRARVTSRQTEHYWYELDADAVRTVFAEASAEDEALALVTVREEVLNRNVRKESTSRKIRA
jgi:DNA-directed RNA polymerase specialized sigma24 family protein